MKIKNELSAIKVEINKEQKAIKSSNILLKSLTGISPKHGDDVNVRLKNGNVKFGQRSNSLKNFVSGSRYQAERQEAAKYFGSEDREVSAAEAKVRKADEANQKIRKDFSMVYQSNAGCKALNVEARHQFAR
ncbi:Uncharacterised protein [Yersinia nurmii]|uniref:Uncharacterized protein n=1 Tax=Yersinia nurmii TaxID=685706 RepID=A0ABP1Y9K6_9GAMM|nr:hypothetical protein [Yersinia nurmii]CNE09415.1 Uncharacterised protein [Yersinia nurmii]